MRIVACPAWADVVRLWRSEPVVSLTRGSRAFRFCCLEHALSFLMTRPTHIGRSGCAQADSGGRRNTLTRRWFGMEFEHERAQAIREMRGKMLAAGSAVDRAGAKDRARFGRRSVTGCRARMPLPWPACHPR